MAKRKSTLMDKRKPKKARTLSARVAKLERAVEPKFWDFALKADQTSGGYTVVGSVYRLNQITQGVGNNQRIGDKVHVESVQLRLHARVEEGAGLPGIRTVLLWDECADGGTLNGASYFDYSTVIDGEEYLSNLAVTKMDQVKVLFDDVLGTNKDSAQAVNGTSTGASVVNVTTNAWRKIDMPTRFNSTTGIAETGSLLLVLIGNQWASPTTDPVNRVALTTRIRYTDA